MKIDMFSFIKKVGIRLDNARLESLGFTSEPCADSTLAVYDSADSKITYADGYLWKVTIKAQLHRDPYDYDEKFIIDVNHSDSPFGIIWNVWFFEEYWDTEFYEYPLTDEEAYMH